MRKARTKSRHRKSHFSLCSLLNVQHLLLCAGILGCSSESKNSGPSSQRSPLFMALFPQHSLRAELKEMPRGRAGQKGRAVGKNQSGTWGHPDNTGTFKGESTCFVPQSTESYSSEAFVRETLFCRDPHLVIFLKFWFNNYSTTSNH